ncbi:MAG: hypothetical protein HKO57_10540 [Akkermansiaceae bacterium]|nr:hypothetical protein [Akkermansiaceae bacterium]
MRNYRSKSSPAGRWRSCSLSIALLAATGTAAAVDSFLLTAPEPREGLFRDVKEFATVGTLAHTVPDGPFTYAETLQHEWMQMKAEGRSPRLLYFFCTVYYTARESGFRAEENYDMKPETRSRLGGKKFPASFLRAVVMEGFGRMEKPVGGKNYIKYDGRWGYGSYPLGNRNNKLRDRVSAAVHRKNRMFGKGTPFLILEPEIHRLFGNMRFEAADTGGGLFENQVDLYWGEDDPAGSSSIAMAASCPIGVWWIVPVVFGK